MLNVDYDKLEAKGVDSSFLQATARASVVAFHANETLEFAVNNLVAKAKPFEPGESYRFTRLIHVFQKIFSDRKRRVTPVRVCAEFVRQLVTGEVNAQRWKNKSFGLLTISVPDDEGETSDDLTFIDAVRFIATVDDFKHLAYKNLFEVVENKSDDCYGDFLDSLILAGPDVYAKVCCGAYKKGDWQRLRDDIREATGDELSDFIINGENYLVDSMREMVQKYFSYWVRDNV